MEYDTDSVQKPWGTHSHTPASIVALSAGCVYFVLALYRHSHVPFSQFQCWAEFAHLCSGQEMSLSTVLLSVISFHVTHDTP